ncbi:MAG: Ca-activated chloride channel family protein [Limisphaerales bacterium]|jgi:Ca-activated chloride channel family protein
MQSLSRTFTRHLFPLFTLTLICLAFLAFSSNKNISLFGGEVHGKVIEKESGQEVLYCNIICYNSGTAIVVTGAVSDLNGEYHFQDLPAGEYDFEASFVGYNKLKKKAVVKQNQSIELNFELEAEARLQAVVIVDESKKIIALSDTRSITRAEIRKAPSPQTLQLGYLSEDVEYEEDISELVFYAEPNADIKSRLKNRKGRKASTDTLDHNTEAYDHIVENPFKVVQKNPLSTFSIDVDAASYANVRRYLDYDQAPPADAVRIEELVNYFTYEYPQPADNHPFSINTEISETPWNDSTRLIHIGLQGKDIDMESADPSNLVFLIDVSGSMNNPSKLGLVKNSLSKLVDQLSGRDKVAIVVYAGAAGEVLPATSGMDKSKIKSALGKLQAGGSTAGGQGLKLAYKIAEDNLLKDGNNRVILCTDGDFNVGPSSDSEMVRLIEEKRKTGIYITVCGFGMGNYKDSKMEKIADHGNGNYYYIDQEKEAHKVFVTEMRSTLFTIAKDVKLQLEFNPVMVKSYRLIGYENRMLAKEDFNDDKKDAGELGAGHTVTALYEVVLNKADRSPQANISTAPNQQNKKVDDLKYQKTTIQSVAYQTDEILTLKLRYKSPDEEVSKLIVHPLIYKQSKLEESSDNFRWSAAVASWGMILRGSQYKGDSTIKDVLTLAKGAKGPDFEGYRADFLKMVTDSKSQFAQK